MSTITLKILLVGDSSVGKTTLINKYVEDKFSDSHITTVGVEYKEKEIIVNNRKINLQIWDTSGQERYHSITKNFYRNADGIIFIFDIANKDSFDHLRGWLNTSQDCENDFKIIIVGNKVDLNDDRVVNKEMVDRFAEKECGGIKYFETIGKDGTNVELVFKEMAELILGNKTDEEINEEFLIRPHSSSTLSKDSQKLENPKKKCC